MTLSVGPYRLLREIGHGGMGIVYLARKGRRGPEVALKLLGSWATMSDAQALLRELRIQAELDHSRIVKFLDSGLVDGRPYLVAEYLPGGSLRHLLSGHGALSPGQAVTAISQAAEALEYAHKRGIIHRDIKPENVYLDGAGGVKLGDFGLAKAVEGGMTVTLPGSLAGSPAYMSPEQVAGAKRLTSASDVYQLAVLAYELLTGYRPFEAQTASVLMQKVLREEPTNPKELQPALPDEACAALLAGMDKDPNKRPGSAGDFARELGRAFGGEAAALPAIAPRPAGSEAHGTGVGTGVSLPTGIRGRRRGMWAAICLLSLLALVLFAAAGYYLWGPLMDGDLKTGPAGSTVTSSETVTLEEAVSAKTDAEMTYERVRKVDRGQGMGALLDAMEKVNRNADALLREKAFRSAKLEYLKLADLCKTLQKKDAERQAAALAKGEADTARLTAEGADAKTDAASLYSDADLLFTTATAAFDEGRLDEAAKVWRRAAEAYGRARVRAEGVARVRAAKAEYEVALKGLDAGKLDRYGGEVWSKVRQAVKSGEEAGEDAEAVVKAYGDAVKLLPQATEAAQKQEAKQQYDSAMAAATQALAKEDFDTAEKEAKTARSLMADRKEADALLVRIANDRAAARERERKALYDKAIASAKAALGNSNFDAAMREADAAKEIAPNGPELESLLKAIAEAKTAAVKKDRLEQYKKAVAAAQAALAKNDFDSAAREIGAALALVPDGAEVRALQEKLVPTLRVAAQVDSRDVAGAQITVNGTLQKDTTPATFVLEKGGSYTVEVAVPPGSGKSYEKTSRTFRADWAGTQAYTAAVTKLAFRVPTGFRAKAGSAPESYTNTGWAKEIVHETTGMELVFIPAGEFLMGSPASEAERSNDETQHRVRISKPFYMGKYEVTQGEWQGVIGTNPSNFKGSNRLPVEQVSWDDTQEFLRKAGGGLRLPTEAEWEYACRAGAQTRFSVGNADSAFDEYAWYTGNSGNQTHPVGQKRPNLWGLYDMHGNVWEWCADWYGDYPGGTVTDPTGAASGQGHVLRGGCWRSDPRGCRSGCRCRLAPGYLRGDGLGFRVAVSSSGVDLP